ncbi:MAG TPA: aminotransferase class I/II-fold pyridoxal phosphate-dependent enzyme [Blastocatellia bacterium]|nr:aminotransferase class I/II-fold pyridoxal phosphate-dependent enzyme [Blastocatellia bacterium]
MADGYKQIDTKLIHAGEPSPRIKGAAVMPIFQSSTYESTDETSYHDVKYLRLNNTPNHIALHEKLAALENAEAALVTASGMAAITTSLLTVLTAGDHLLIQSTLYGGTHDFVTKDLAGFALSYDFIDLTDPDSWQSKLRPNTKAVYVESMSNPTLEVGDLKAVVAFAKANGLVSLIDNTFASPVNFRPPERGFDVSLHSCTKYLNGHTDIVAGAAIGRADLVKRITHRLNHLGGSLDPHAAFLLHRGMKTLALRVRHQNESTLRLAQFLENHPRVARVNYPGLESHASYRRARELFDGFGGVLSFEVAGDSERTERFMARVKIPIIGPSLGGVETLMTRPATTSHLGLTPEDRRRIGITDTLIRVSVGIESVEDIIEDFAEALGS